jgi:hypothetical protein
MAIKYIKMAIKYTKWPEIRPNGHTYNIPTSSIAKPSQIYPNWYFRFEKIPSGNPGERELPAILLIAEDKSS